MYMEYYGLTADPFRLTADRENLYSHRTLSKARSYLQYGLQMSEGIVLVTGESGTGKSTLINSVVTDDLQIRLDPVVIECSNYTGGKLLSNYASILSGTNTSANIPEALNTITHLLLQIKSEGKKALLVLDEAQQLTDDALFKLLQLANLKINGEQLVQIHLVGLPQLRDTILRPEHEQLHQRLVATCSIEPLTAVETEQYIIHCLTSAGWNGTPRISRQVFKLIHNTSLGIPRWINLSGSRLLLHGMANEKQNLELSDVCEVLRELLSEDLLPSKVRRINQKDGKTQAA
ncbi:AAA family ATPase [Granulosicoccus sp.]|nr:AAA family ATPase [Granulosicoccus sp.]